MKNDKNIIAVVKSRRDMMLVEEQRNANIKNIPYYLQNYKHDETNY